MTLPDYAGKSRSALETGLEIGTVTVLGKKNQNQLSGEEYTMTALLGISRLIDRITEIIGKSVSWLILVAVLVSAGNAIIRKIFNMSSNAWLVNMAPVMFAALVVFLLLGYPVAFALAANGLLFAWSASSSGCSRRTSCRPCPSASTAR
jgi:hypothetical protein